MKKLFFLLACVAMSMLAMGQDNQLVWANGRLLYGTPVENIDSLTYDEMEDIDTLHLLLPRTLIKVVHDTVYIHDTVYVETDCGGEGDTPSAGIGVFSVSADKQVTFSKGNLQYTQSTNTWSFASAQWEMLGTDNVTGGSVSSDPTIGDSKLGTGLADKVDLFCWSTSATNFGVSTSTDNNDYSGFFVDWGTNKIGNDAPDTWRTLTYDEWEYLLNTRPNASSLKGVAQVNGVNGLIFLPDNWTCPTGVTFKSGFHSEWGVDYYAAYQTFTADQWSTLEAAGAVFLPAAGYRHGSNVDFVQIVGSYWSATECLSNSAYSLGFYSDGAYRFDYDLYFGLSVRLVKDIEGGGATPDTPDTPVEPEEPDTPTEPEEPTNPSAGIGVFSVSADKQVTFSKGNLQYTQSTNTWSFAENQWEVIGTDNVIGGSVSSYEYGDYKYGDALADKVDLFGWSTATMNFGVSTSTSSSDYSISFVDWGANKIDNDAPNTWRTLSYDEWWYLRYDRTNADDLVGVAQVNGVNGLILLPDNWTCPAGVTFKSGFHNNDGVEYYAAYQTFTAAEWSKLEAAGAVFLPAAGTRDGSDAYYVQYNGRYWSATESGSLSARCFSVSSDGAGMSSDSRYDGNSVRLVKDIEGGGATPDTPDTPTEPEEPTNPSAGIGVFSVGEGETVTFSKGNLQYTQSTNTWSFASAQWEVIGTGNVTGGSVSSNPTTGDRKEGTALADKVDLFGWSTSANNFGVSTYTYSDSDYSGSFVDWGTNKIGNDAPNTWRTLSYDEWYYVVFNRPNASSLKGVAQVNGVNGLILLPDNWTCPAGVTFKSGIHSNYGVDYYAAYQTFTAAEWSKLEAAGAVFLPAAGYRNGSNVDYVQYYGRCWSATESLSNSAYCLYFTSDAAGMNDCRRGIGLSVRLVKDL